MLYYTNKLHSSLLCVGKIILWAASHVISTKEIVISYYTWLNYLQVKNTFEYCPWFNAFLIQALSGLMKIVVVIASCPCTVNTQVGTGISRETSQIGQREYMFLIGIK